MVRVTETTTSLEEAVGHPGEKWSDLKQRIQDESVRDFATIQADWLDLMWTLDAYRAAKIAPRDMGKAGQDESVRLAAIYRQKGNWFATALTLILGNQTSLRLAPRSRVRGFSQLHQVDIAWPDRDIDPLVCLETKVTGACASGSTKARGAMNDWTNRRKELKFAAADLKLHRRENQKPIRHWDAWRQDETPKTYFLWAARMTPRDSLTRMISEAQALVKTYLDGAGLFAWREVDGHYEAVAFPDDERVSRVDDVLYLIASKIQDMAGPQKQEPPPRRAIEELVDIRSIAPDKKRQDE